MGTTPTPGSPPPTGRPSTRPNAAHRWSESPAAPYLAAFAAVYAALSGLVWLAGEVAGWLWTRRWPPTDGTDALAVLAYLLRHPGNPSLAWPVAARHDLAPAPLFYAVVALLFAAITVPAARLALAYVARRRRWADSNPRRAGFATSVSRTTLLTASWPRAAEDDDPVVEAAG